MKYVSLSTFTPLDMNICFHSIILNLLYSFRWYGLWVPNLRNAQRVSLWNLAWHKLSLIYSSDESCKDDLLLLQPLFVALCQNKLDFASSAAFHSSNKGVTKAAWYQTDLSRCWIYCRVQKSEWKWIWNFKFHTSPIYLPIYLLSL